MTEKALDKFEASYNRERTRSQEWENTTVKRDAILANIKMILLEISSNESASKW